MFKRSLVQTARSAVARPAIRSSPIFRDAARVRYSPVVAVSPLQGPARTARWYSEENKPAEEKKEEAPKENKEVEELKKQLEEKTKEVADFKDKFLRSVADFRNLQERTKREMQAAKDFAIQKFAKDLLDSVDNLDRALAAVPEESRKPEKNKELADLYEGIKMTEGILLKTLKKHGLERTDPVGEKFDPNVHEATFHVHMPGKEPNEVFHVQQKGFVLNGRVLRAAQVGVTKAAS